ncbi:MAG: response regulator transcription factor [Adlercreutzia sp.]
MEDGVVREELMRLLELQGHTALTGTAFDRIVDDVLAAAPDCVILDLKLPGTGGHTVCRDLRRSSQVPVIMLTSSDSEFDEVLSMNLGADDYVTKPYNPAVLLARINRFCAVRSVPSRRRVSASRRGVDVARGRVEHGGRSVDLTRNELKILHMLMANHTIISRQELMVELAVRCSSTTTR